MAALNFPDPNVTTSYTNPDTGITYEWANGIWKAVRTAQTAPELFVDADGDNLTGNLTLGTDKIVLNATDGGAAFANDVVIGDDAWSDDNSVGVTLRNEGQVTARRASSSIAGLFTGYAVGVSAPTSAIYSDGSATFAGDGHFKCGGTAHAEMGVQFINDGEVKIYRPTGGGGSVNLISGSAGVGAMVEQFAIKADGRASFGPSPTQQIHIRPGYTGNADAIWLQNTDNSRPFLVTAEGSATFDDIVYGGAFHITNSKFTLETDELIRLLKDSERRFVVRQNGSAYFASNVGIGTTSPGRILHVDSGSTSNSYVRFTNSNSVSNGAEVGLFDSGAAGPALVLNNSMSDGIVVLNTQSLERMRIDSSGNVGINQVSPTSQSGKVLHISGDNGGQARIHLTTSASGHGANEGSYIVALGAESGASAGSLVFQNHENKDIIFSTGTSSTEKLRIQNAGGISFNGDTATANALDDYEEGTFTPTIDVTGTSGTLSVHYLYNTGRYVKIGRLCQVTIDIRLQQWTRGTGTGGIMIVGLPFTPVDSGNFTRSNGFANLYNWNYSATSGDIPVFAVHQDAGHPWISLSIHRSGSTDSDVSDPSNDSMLFLTAVYETAY